MGAFLVVVIFYFFFMFDNLAVKFVNQFINGNIHIVSAGIGKNLVAADQQRSFCLMVYLFFY